MKRFTPFGLPPGRAPKSTVSRAWEKNRAPRSTVSRAWEIGLATLGLAAAVLICAPQSAFAQHGGGGHAGGGHAGGGGGHAAGYTGGRSAGSAHVTAPTHATSAVPPSRLFNAARTPSGSSLPPGWAAALNRPSAPTPGKGIPEFSAAPPHTTIGFPPTGRTTTFPTAPLRSGPLSFSGEGHQIWQDPAPSTSGASLRGPAGEFHPQPPHRIHRQPPFFFPGAFYPSFGFFGFTPFLGFGWGPGCDPSDPWLFGCGAYGMGYGFTYPYGYGYGYYPPEWGLGGTISPDENSTETGPFMWQNPPAGEAGPPASDTNSRSNVVAPNSVLYLQDGTNYDITDYWVAEDKLHYVTNYGGENSVDLSQVDIQRTVDANASRGLSFSLHPAAPAPLTPPPSTDSAPPAPPAPPEPSAPPSPAGPQ